MKTRSVLQSFAVLTLTCLVAIAQTPGNNKQYVKDGLTLDYPAGWTMQDDSNGDAQQLTFARANNDVQIRVFIHRGRVTPEKLADAKKGFIDPYIASTGKQFVQMGATPKQSPDSTEIAGVKAEGVAITASLGGEPGAAKIYWAIVGSRVVLLTFFGPDKELKQFESAWDLIKGSIKIDDPKAAPKPSPTP